MKTRKLILSIFACGAVALTFSTTTYAWFRIGSSGYVSNLDFKVISGLGFKIAADGSDSSYYTDNLDSKLIKSAIVRGYNPDKYVFYKNSLYEYTPSYENKSIDGEIQKVLVEEKFRLISEEEMDTIIKNIQLVDATTMLNTKDSNGNPTIVSDGYTLYDIKGNKITNHNSFLEFDLYFKADSDMATDNQHFGIYLSDDTEYAPFGDNSKMNPDGTPYKEAMNPTQITSAAQNVKLFNKLTYMDSNYEVKNLNSDDEINVSLANAMRFSVKDNGEITVTPKSENKSENTYKFDEGSTDTFTITRGINEEYLTSILPDLTVNIGAKTDTQARIYEIANEGNLGSYATNYSGEDENSNRLYNSTYNPMYTYFESTHGFSFDSLDYESLIKMYEDGYIYDSFNDSQIMTILDSGLKAHKITFKFWLEGYDADYFAGVSGLESLKCNLSFKVNSAYKFNY